MRIELNREGVRELLRSESIQEILREATDPAMGRLGDGYERDTHVGSNRCNVGIYPTTPEAYRDCLKNNTILKAVLG